MQVKTGVEKYDTIKARIGGQEFMVPVIACTPDPRESDLLEQLQDYFNQCGAGLELADKFVLEAGWVRSVLSLIYDELPDLRITRKDFDKVIEIVTQGTLGEGSGVSAV